MKTLILFASLVFVTNAAYSQQDGFLTNGNLEIWKNGKVLPQGWSTFHTVEREGIFKKSKEAHSESHAIQIDFTPQKEHDNRRFFSSVIKLDEGSHKFHLYLKGRGEIRFISLHREGEDASGKDSDVNMVGTPSINKINNKSWAKKEVLFEVKQRGSYRVTICINQAEALLIDDLSLNLL